MFIHVYVHTHIFVSLLVCLVLCTLDTPLTSVPPFPFIPYPHYLSLYPSVYVANDNILGLHSSDPDPRFDIIQHPDRGE